MKRLIQTRTGIRIGSAGKLGRGVFATKSFKKGDLIEVAPILIFDSDDSVLIDRTDLHRFCYVYETMWCGHERLCVGLGYTSLYNHSTRPNADYEIAGKQIEIRALKAIKKDAQIKINYNGDPGDKTRWDFTEGNSRQASR